MQQLRFNFRIDLLVKNKDIRITHMKSIRKRNDFDPREHLDTLIQTLMTKVTEKSGFK